MNENATQEQLLDLIGVLNKDNKVNGILVQMPLPKHQRIPPRPRQDPKPDRRHSRPPPKERPRRRAMQTNPKPPNEERVML